MEVGFTQQKTAGNRNSPPSSHMVLKVGLVGLRLGTRNGIWSRLESMKFRAESSGGIELLKARVRLGRLHWFVHTSTTSKHDSFDHQSWPCEDIEASQV